MQENTVLDIISPIMAGPSSSHTAGAVRIGLLARNIFDDEIKKVKITLYNSYASTGRGHGTDKGIIAGLLGFSVDSTMIKDIFNSIEATKIKYLFEYQESFTHHPNAVDFTIEGNNNALMEISAQSVGGGEVLVTKINGVELNIDGKLNTIVVTLSDEPGSIAKLTNIIQQNCINIASLNCDRKSKGQSATCAICVDGCIEQKTIDEIKEKLNPIFIRYIKKLPC